MKISSTKTLLEKTLRLFSLSHATIFIQIQLPHGIFSERQTNDKLVTRFLTPVIDILHAQ